MKSPFKRGIIRVLFVCALLGAIIPVETIMAQSAAMMQMSNSELQKRGLSESEVRTRLLAEGIDADNIQPSEYPQYQSRVISILDEMAAEKKQSAAAQPVVVNVGSADGESEASTEQSASENISSVDVPATTAAEATAEAEQRVAQADAAKSGAGASIYGHTLFTDHTLDVFRTTDGAQAPDNYILGEGDEIHISIFGGSQIEMQQRIGSDGSIKPASSARIFLKGLTLAQARSVISKSLSASYMFNDDQLAVTIVAARTIMVNIFGEVNISGGFSISALNSAFNALSAAGGPSAIGSVRNIQLIRGRQKETLDLYAFMKDPTKNNTLDLQNNDIIFVPVRDKVVSINGAVRRPMSYELVKNEDLKDLISFAGGLTQNVYPEFVQIQRYDNGEQQLLEYNLASVMSGKTTVKLLDGDQISIKSINKPFESYVRVEGSVYYPGTFNLEKNSTITAVLKNAMPNTNAKTDLLFVERTMPDNTVQVLAITYPGYNGAPDFNLQEKDVVRILDQAAYRDVETIAVSGNVRRPFSRDFGLNDHMTVGEAIEYAGGLKESVYPVAYIFRKNLLNPKEITYIRIELEEAKDMKLQPGDRLNIYDNTTFTNIGEVSAYGAVKNPVSVAYDQTLSVHDLLTMSGGFEVGAAYNHVEVFRTTLSPTEKPKLELITLEVDSTYNIVTPADFKLQPYDRIIVRRVPEFQIGGFSVELNGRVRVPGTYILPDRQTHLSEVIAMAGGLIDDADPNGTRLFRTYNNRGDISMNLDDAMQHKMKLSCDPIVFDGDVINVNKIENTVTIRETGTRMAQYVPEATSSNVKNIIFQGKKSARWYIKNYAGGFQKNADKRSVTMTLPNGQMVGTSQFMGIRNYPNIESGATITMRMDVERVKKEAEPKEKVDWDSTMARLLSTLVSTVSVIAIVAKL